MIPSVEAPSLVHRNVAPPKQKKPPQTRTTPQTPTRRITTNQSSKSSQKRSYCQAIAYGLLASVAIGTALWLKFGMGGDGTA